MFKASGEVPAESTEAEETTPTWSVAENVDHAVGIVYRGSKLNPLFAPHQIELERGIGVAQVHATLALVGMLERIDKSIRDLTTEVRKHRAGA